MSMTSRRFRLGRAGRQNPREIAYRPARVLMQDFTGVPAVVDLAAMRDGIKALGGDPQKINPLNPVDLVIDHSVMIDEFGNPRAFQMNVDREYERNMERYTFLKWGQSAFDNFRVVPPGTGICHQVNLEYLAKTVWFDTDQAGEMVAYPDTLVGTDSHTTMVNGAAVLGWGVGGIEAEAAMLGQPISMLIPEVVGFELTGADGRRHHRHRPCSEGRRDAARQGRGRQVRGILRRGARYPAAGRPRDDCQHGARIRRDLRLLPDRRRNLRYLRNTGRPTRSSRWSRPTPRKTVFWRGADYAPVYTDTLSLDMGTIVPAISGPKRPQDYVALTDAKSAFTKEMAETFKRPMGEGSRRRR
jgi:aconitate hydratase